MSQSSSPVPQEPMQAEERHRRHALETLGQLLPGVLHEWNNPVSYVVGNMETLEEYIAFLKDGAVLLQQAAAHEAGPPPAWRNALQQWLQREDVDDLLVDVDDLLKETREGLGQLPPMSQSLRLYLRQRCSQPERYDANWVLDHTMLLMHNRLKYSVQVRREQTKTRPVQGDPMLLCHALVNVLHNATLAMPERGELVVRSRQEDNRLFLQIEDNGCGMSSEQLEQALEFNTSFWPISQARGIRYGLGLSLARQFVQEQGGGLSLASTPGQGTQVTLWLPTLSERASSTTPD